SLLSVAKRAVQLGVPKVREQDHIVFFGLVRQGVPPRLLTARKGCLSSRALPQSSSPFLSQTSDEQRTRLYETLAWVEVRDGNDGKRVGRRGKTLESISD